MEAPTRQASPSKRARRHGDIEALVGSICAIAGRLGKLQAQARALGIFTADRDLLTCPKCGLMEDVLADGRLVTYHKEGDRDDTGLRFIESAPESGRFTCPECGIEFVSPPAESRGGTR